jgi:hypothetical protein
MNAQVSLQLPAAAIKKQVVETTCESHEKNSITATGFISRDELR